MTIDPSDDEAVALRSPSEAAEYVRQMAAELALIARSAKLDALAYLLDMAELEATRNVSRIAQRDPP